jgi:predicted dienelactone hydrolase
VSTPPSHRRPHGPSHRRRPPAAVRRRRLAVAGTVAGAALAVALTALLDSSSPARTGIVHTAATASTTTTTTTVPTTTTSAPRPVAAPVTTTTTRPPGPPYAVASSTVILVDPSRPTPARGSVPQKSGRVLRTIVRTPVGRPGPLPMVVFVHGWNAEPEMYETLLDSWAAAGYLVVAPECPGSARNLPGTPISDYAEQALDVSFVITQALHGAVGPVDPNRIAAAGHSDGGTTMAILALASQYQDPRIKAYLALAAQIPPDVNAQWGATRMPGVLLVAVGTADEYGNEQLSTQLYDTAQMTKAFVNVPGGSHLGPFVDATPVGTSVRAATVALLDLVLETPGPVTAARLVPALESPPGSGAYQVTAADS